MSKICNSDCSIKSLPDIGMSRWKQFSHLIPFSKEKFRQLVNQGKAPQPIRFSERCTAYSNHEILKFLRAPLNYRSSDVENSENK